MKPNVHTMMARWLELVRVTSNDLRDIDLCDYEFFGFLMLLSNVFTVLNILCFVFCPIFVSTVCEVL